MLRPNADWPKLREIFTHLHLRPWILLPHAFDHEACLTEAKALLDRFVVHRPEGQRGPGKWKSLSIRAAGGDPSRTLGEEQYGSSDEEASYRLTEVAEKCPRTLDFLRSITDLDQCERVRFMLLEPGAEIDCHSDVPHKPHSLALNIALNMPEGCEFWADLRPDGSVDRFSHRIPLTDGSVFLFNTSTYHRVVNHSSTPRIHIIVHGPTYFTDDCIINAARKQNRLPTHQDALAALLSKLSWTGDHPGRRAEARIELEHHGSIEQFPPEIAFGVCQETLEDALIEEESLQVTKAGLFPLIPEVFPDSLLAEWIGKQAKSGKECAVVLNAGHFIPNQLDFVCAVIEACARIKSSGVPLAGHLALKPGRLPYLNEQFFLIDLAAWRKLGSPELGKPYEWFETGFPAFERSPENVHGEHSPLWIRPASAPGAAGLQGKGGFGTRLIASLLERGHAVETTPASIRRQKSYSYPRSGRGENYWRVRRERDDHLTAAGSQLFVFNTERLLLRDYGIRPTVIFSPCSGLKPLSLLRQFGAPGCRLVLMENSEPALAYYRRLLSCQTYGEVVSLMETTLRNSGRLPEDPKYVRSALRAVLSEGFGGEPSELMRWLRIAASSAEFRHLDYFTRQDEIVDALRPDDRLLFWHSNAWESGPALYRSTMAGLLRNYRELVGKIADRLGTDAWVHKATFDAILGEDFHGPRAVLTLGGKKTAPPKPAAYEPLFGEGDLLRPGHGQHHIGRAAAPERKAGEPAVEAL